MMLDTSSCGLDWKVNAADSIMHVILSKVLKKMTQCTIHRQVHKNFESHSVNGYNNI